MKRWGWALAAVILACLPILATRAMHVGLLQDTDTQAILAGIEKRQSPLSWFVTDWPLENHFYRPVATLTFELDQRLHPGDPAGFGATNAFIAVGCVMMLFWFLRELTDKPWLAAASASLFAVWNAFPNAPASLAPCVLVACGIGFVASLVGDRHPLKGVAGLLVGLYASQELAGMVQFRGGALDWLPGRTATTMAFFCLAAMAMYARYVRLSGERIPTEPTPLDRPATKGTELRVQPTKGSSIWIVGAAFAAALALGSYEQAVMLPACLIGVAVAYRLRGYRTALWPHAVIWALLALYWTARKAFIPPGASQYQLQQYRSSIDVYLTLLDYVLPAGRPVRLLLGQLEFGLPSVLMNQWPALLGILSSTIALVYIWGKRIGPLSPRDWTPLTGYALSFLAFLPMAWLKQFQAYNHYHYWPMAFRAFYAISLLVLTAQLMINAVSRRPIQAPPRLAPEPR